MFADKDVYLIGIGGCGMSGLARMLAAAGARVAGADSTLTAVTTALVIEGIDVHDDAGPMPEACDVVVASAAIKPDHPQMIEAQRRGIEALSYAEALGRCMAGRTGVALAGTHGKSTTTAMLGTALVDAGLDPSVIVGARCGQLAGGALGEPEANRSATGFRLGSAEIPAGPLAGEPGLLLCEACEYNRSFHNLRPRIASISAVEADHLDIYGSLDAVVEAFHRFAQLLPDADAGGRLLIAHEGGHRREVTAGVRCAVETIGFSPGADFSVIYDPGDRCVTLMHERRTVARWTMRMPGDHNAMNAATACALAIMLGADPDIIAQSLGAFEGVERRTEFLGERVLAGGGVVRVWDDYGHHPTEIDKTLRALREFENPERHHGRLICVFQPHQHSRTRFLLDEFASSFEHADIVIVPHIYFVRDSQAEKHKVSSSDLVDRLRTRGVRAMHLYPFDAIVEQLENVCRAGDVLVVMGAGPVWEVAHKYMAGGMDAGSVRTREVSHVAGRV
ncbi:MAG: UDP-N-acetylmuramate--L-alanine ligase [Planctomycetes bacterium]|nr:UDP-N-acetylmuramate--L-alanine ligase [Planctomycetota bacterium]